MSFQIADTWFEKNQIDGDITLIYEPHVVPMVRCNIWHIRGLSLSHWSENWMISLPLMPSQTD